MHYNHVITIWNEEKDDNEKDTNEKDDNCVMQEETYVTEIVTGSSEIHTLQNYALTRKQTEALRGQTCGMMMTDRPAQTKKNNQIGFC